MKKIFVDTKYTSSDENTKQPISISFIELESGQCCYVEFSDFYVDGCNENALNNIIPNLKNSPDSRPTIVAGMHKLSKWLEQFGEVMIIGENIDDFYTINNYMKNSNNLVTFAWISQIIINELDISTEATLESALEHFNKIKEIHFEHTQTSPYNALDDAKAIYHAYNTLIKDPLLKRTYKNH